MKSQVSSMFTYLSAAIILGVVLVFGGWGVIKLINVTEDIEKSTFQSDFNRAIGELTTQYGAVRYVELPSLRAYKEICVVDPNWFSDLAVPATFDGTNLSRFPLILGDIQDKTANIFLITDTVAERFLNNKTYLANPTQRYVCYQIPQSGIVKMRVEGYGKYATIEFVD